MILTLLERFFSSPESNTEGGCSCERMEKINERYYKYKELRDDGAIVIKMYDCYDKRCKDCGEVYTSYVDFDNISKEAVHEPTETL